jgi:hypothetical protein
MTIPAGATAAIVTMPRAIRAASVVLHVTESSGQDEPLGSDQQLSKPRVDKRQVKQVGGAEHHEPLGWAGVDGSSTSPAWQKLAAHRRRPARTRFPIPRIARPCRPCRSDPWPLRGQSSDEPRAD